LDGRERLVTLAWFHIASAITWVIAKILFRLEVVGIENVPKKGPFIIASSHASNIDPPILSALTHIPIRYWAKAELLKVPLLRTFLKGVRIIPIHRGQPDKASLRCVFDALKDGEVLLLFPEGTRSRTGQLQAGQRGAGMIWARADVPLVPVYIEGAYEAWPPGKKFPRPRKIRIHVGPALMPPKDFGLASTHGDPYDHLAELIMRRIRARQVLV